MEEDDIFAEPLSPEKANMSSGRGSTMLSASQMAVSKAAEEGHVQQVLAKLKHYVRISGNITTLLRTITYGDGPQHAKTRSAVFFKCLELLDSDQLSTKMATMMIDALVLMIEKVGPEELIKATEYFLRVVRGETSDPQLSKRSLDLLPTVLAALTSIEKLPEWGSGELYKDHYLQKLCSKAWVSSVTGLVNTLRDIQMSQEQLKFAISRVIRSLGDVEIEELPALTYQLLLLSSKGHRQLVLSGISQHMMERDKQCNPEDHQDDGDAVRSTQAAVTPRRIRPLQGTILVHFSFVIQQDQELGKEYMKYLKQCSDLSSFSFALALSVARIQRFQDAIFDYLKPKIVRTFKEEERMRDSKWASTLVDPPASMESLIETTIQNCQFGWDQVIQGLVLLGFKLLDSYKYDKPVLAVPSVNHRACKLGVSILVKLFEEHEAVRDVLLDKLLNRLVSKGGSSLDHFNDVYRQIAGFGCQLLAAQLPRIKEAFVYLAHLSTETAAAFLDAMIPLTENAGLRDALFLVLRKALFSRDVNARSIALSGYLQVLDKGKDMSIRDELIGNMRRCLSQQGSIREQFYHGIARLITLHPELRPNFQNLLKHQFLKLYQPGDAQPPFLLQKCVVLESGSYILVEPFHHLIATLGSFEERDAELTEFLSSLAARFAKSELEDFDMDKEAEYSSNTVMGARNRIFLQVLAGVAEALLGFTWQIARDFDVESCQLVVKLYQRFMKYTSMLRDADKKEKRHKVDPPVITLQLKTLVNMAHALNSNDIPEHQNGLLMLRAKPGLIRHVFQSVVTITRQVKEGVHHSREVGRNGKELPYNLCEKIACVMLEEYSVSMDEPDLKALYEDKKEGRDFKLICLQAVHSMLVIVTRSYPEKLVRFFGVLDQATTGGEEITSQTGLPEAVYKVFRWFKAAFAMVLSEYQTKSRLVTTVLEVIACCLELFPSDSTQLRKARDWVYKTCKEQESVDDAAIVKSLISLLLDLERRRCGELSRLLEVVSDIRIEIGSCSSYEESEESIDEKKLNIIHLQACETNPAIPMLALQHVGNSLSDLEWAIGRVTAVMQSEALTDYDSQDCGTEDVRMCKAICSHFKETAKVVLEVVQTSYPHKTAESVLRTATRVFKAIVTFVRYKIAYWKRHKEGISKPFKELLDLVLGTISPEVYNLITFLQNTPVNDKKNHGAAAKSLAQRQLKTIPNMIFSIEQCERFVIQLSKLSGANLVKNLKRSTARDFRIDPEELQQAIAKGEISSDEDEVSKQKGKRKRKGTETSQRKSKKTGQAEDEMEMDEGSEDGADSDDEEENEDED